MKVKVKVLTEGCEPVVISKGDWIDLKAAKETTFKAPYATILHKTNNGQYRDVEWDYKLIPLGFAMKLPEGFEAHMLPRSSTFKKYGILCANSQGIIDNSYSGNNDEWKFPALAFKDVTIPKGERICQFRITLSQKANFWQKIQWLFAKEIVFEYVDDLESEDRGGFGSTDCSCKE